MPQRARVQSSSQSLTWEKLRARRLQVRWLQVRLEPGAERRRHLFARDLGPGRHHVVNDL